MQRPINLNDSIQQRQHGNNTGAGGGHGSREGLPVGEAFPERSPVHLSTVEGRKIRARI